MCAQFFYKKNHKRIAFSLVEILITLLIVSLLMVSIAPILTKKLFPKQSEGLVYTYSQDNNIQTDGRCYMTGDAYDTTHSENYPVSYACSRYTFVVPDGVHSVNLTLVAGGGGGGGAQPPITGLQAYTVSTGNLAQKVTLQNAQGFNYGDLKSVKINFLTAKGADGGVANVSTKVTGAGGASSPAVTDFILPLKYLRGYNYTPSLTPDTSGSLIVSNESSAAYVQLGDKVKYTVTADRKVKCEINGTAYEYPNANCAIPEENYLASAAGTAGNTLTSTDTVSVNYISNGGAGGQNTYKSNYGSGGAGDSLQVSQCSGSGEDSARYCTVSNATFVALGAKEAGVIGHASATFEFMKEGRVGTGGAGGAMARVLGFPVSPGETYVIYVGKGGEGGRAGKSGDEHWVGGYVNSTAGTGGTSTAIFKVVNGAETLVYMVNGGQGGYFAEAKTSSNTRTRYAGRNYPKVFSGNATYYNYQFDTEKVSIVNDATGGAPSISGIQSRRLSYPFLSTSPYNLLNGGMGNLLTSSGDTNISSDKKIGGMLGFDLAAPQAVSASDTFYDGLYYRSLVNDFPVYIGSSGGFSGLGGKAGCGGFFLGNFDGRKISGSAPTDEEKRAHINTFNLNSTYYNINDYYDGCSALTPDGHTAEFIMPDPVAHTLGQAGSGGGGGSISPKYGAGKGGDGQNGYVMIEWRR